MSIVYTNDHFESGKIIDLVMRERDSSLSPREWKHRLAGYGYAIKETLHGQMIETLPHREQVCMLPSEMSA